MSRHNPSDGTRGTHELRPCPAAAAAHTRTRHIHTHTAVEPQARRDVEENAHNDKRGQSLLRENAHTHKGEQCVVREHTHTQKGEQCRVRDHTHTHKRDQGEQCLETLSATSNVRVWRQVPAMSADTVDQCQTRQVSESYVRDNGEKCLGEQCHQGDQDGEDGDLPLPPALMLGHLPPAPARATVAVVRTKAESGVKISGLEGGKGQGGWESVTEHEIKAETQGTARANLANWQSDVEESKKKHQQSVLHEEEARIQKLKSKGFSGVDLMELAGQEPQDEPSKAVFRTKTTGLSSKISRLRGVFGQ